MTRSRFPHCTLKFRPLGVGQLYAYNNNEICVLADRACLECIGGIECDRRAQRRVGRLDAKCDNRSLFTEMTRVGPESPSDAEDAQDASVKAIARAGVNEHDTLKYHLLGPSLTKAGQDAVDQQKVDLQQSVSAASYFTSTD